MKRNDKRIWVEIIVMSFSLQTDSRFAWLQGLQVLAVDLDLN